MKRPIAELLTMTLKSGAETERTQYEHEAWQILRRKQGYVTHRIYQRVSEPSERLVYSEWESKKALDGARQHLQGTPPMRRARALLTAPPQRLLVELVGHITSTKGLELGATAVAALATGRLREDGAGWREQEEQLQRVFPAQSGHITHVFFRGFEDPMLAGSMSYWTSTEAFEHARVQLDAALPTTAMAEALTYVVYAPLVD